MTTLDLKPYIRSLPDFPTKGTTYHDISTLLADGKAWHDAMARLSDKLISFHPDVLVGIEPHGYLLAAPLAYRQACGFVRARKSGKVLGGNESSLPGKIKTLDYEYGQVSIQADLIKPGQRVVILDDILATGLTATAVAKLVGEMGGEVVGAAFLIELKGKSRLQVPFCSLVTL